MIQVARRRQQQQPLQQLQQDPIGITTTSSNSPSKSVTTPTTTTPTTPTSTTTTNNNNNNGVNNNNNDVVADLVCAMGSVISPTKCRSPTTKHRSPRRNMSWPSMYSTSSSSSSWNTFLTRSSRNNIDHHHYGSSRIRNNNNGAVGHNNKNIMLIIAMLFYGIFNWYLYLYLTHRNVDVVVTTVNYFHHESYPQKNQYNHHNHRHHNQDHNGHTNQLSYHSKQQQQQHSHDLPNGIAIHDGSQIRKGKTVEKLQHQYNEQHRTHTKNNNNVVGINHSNKNNNKNNDNQNERRIPQYRYKIALIRSVGNALPPRHDANQTIRNMEFILKYEPNFVRTSTIENDRNEKTQLYREDMVYKHWILNRLVDNEVQAAVIRLLERYNTTYTVVPFDLDVYQQIPYNYDLKALTGRYGPKKEKNGPTMLAQPKKVFQLDDRIHDEEYNKQNGTQKNLYLDLIMNDKTLYVTNVNAARNAAIDHVLSMTTMKGRDNDSTNDVDIDGSDHTNNNNGATNDYDILDDIDYILPWDGNCFLTQDGYDSIMLALEENNNDGKNTPPRPYFVTPMDRVTGTSNEILLRPNYRPNPVEEPQIIFHTKAATERFDERLRYGRRNKVELLMRLGVDGPWKHWPWEAWEQEWAHNISSRSTSAPAAGWVSRLVSGNPKLEEGGQSVIRAQSRSESVELFLQQLDERVAIKTIRNENNDNNNHDDIDKKSMMNWIFFNHTVLDRERQRWKHQQSKLSEASMDVGDNDDGFFHLTEDLIRLANNALHLGPWSVTDKQTILHDCGGIKTGKDFSFSNISCHDFFHVHPSLLSSTKNKEEVWDRYDRHRFWEFQFHTTLLGLAHSITNDMVYANKAAENIRHWFVHPDTRMNPHLLYAQIVWSERKWKKKDKRKWKWMKKVDLAPFDSDSLMEFKNLFYFMDVIQLVELSGALTSQDQASLRKWFQQYLEWLTSSAAARQGYFGNSSNGLYYDMQVAAVASYTGNVSTMVQILQQSVSRMLRHYAGYVSDTTGDETNEGGKAKSTTKNCDVRNDVFLFQGWTNLGRMASRIGLDVWGQFQRNNTSPSPQLPIPQPLMCRVANEMMSSLIRDDNNDTATQCNPNGSIGDDQDRWWPIYVEAKRHCSTVKDHFNEVFSLSGSSDSRIVSTSETHNSSFVPPKSHYMIRPWVHDDYGIAPFWNLGLDAQHL